MYNADRLYEEFYRILALAHLQKFAEECEEGVGDRVFCIRASMPIAERIGQMKPLSAIYNSDSVHWESSADDFSIGVAQDSAIYNCCGAAPEASCMQAMIA